MQVGDVAEADQRLRIRTHRVEVQDVGDPVGAGAPARGDDGPYARVPARTRADRPSPLSPRPDDVPGVVLLLPAAKAAPSSCALARNAPAPPPQRLPHPPTVLTPAPLAPHAPPP